MASIKSLMNGEWLSRPSAWALLLVNLVPLVGVLAWGWSVFEIVFLYWLENVIIGVINVLRMAICRGQSRTGKRRTARNRAISGTDHDETAAQPSNVGKKLFMIPFFVVHYGMFCFGHGTFLFALFGQEHVTDSISGSIEIIRELLQGGLLLAASALAISHLVSFLFNFVGGGEYRQTSVSELMARPYGRIIVMHVAILFGALAIDFFGNPIALLILLIVMKTGLDLKMHHSERLKLSAATV